ncbi:hypothetical protein XENTR_v10018850 [Xenopus tropicalis]|nr:hypothetical protein XENTR_v10018850 [Xenopus tropicalis]
MKICFIIFILKGGNVLSIAFYRAYICVYSTFVKNNLLCVILNIYSLAFENTSAHSLQHHLLRHEKSFHSHWLPLCAVVVKINFVHSGMFFCLLAK